MKTKLIVSLLGVATIGFLAWLMLSEDDQMIEKSAIAGRAGIEQAVSQSSVRSGAARTDGTDEATSGDIEESLEPDPDEAEQGDDSNDGSGEPDEDKLVDEFDAATDKWMNSENSNPPTMRDIEDFHEKFRRIPKSRKEECLQRALNLVPDDNVMVLTGILLDKAEDKELVTMVYNDVLNRDDEVKKPILKIIFQDKQHPCWADTAWILDVTGELPEKK